MRLIWVIHPDTRTVDVYQADGTATLSEEDSLSGLDVLPGFACPIKAIFEPQGSPAITFVALAQETLRASGRTSSPNPPIEASRDGLPGLPERSGGGAGGGPEPGSAA